MAKKGMILGMPPSLHHEDVPKYEFCVLGKQTTPIPKSHKEGLVGVDLSGPHVKLRTGNEHIMDIVGD